MRMCAATHSTQKWLHGLSLWLVAPALGRGNLLQLWAVERHSSPKRKISVKKNGNRNGNLSKSLIDIDDPEQVLGLKSMEAHSTDKEHLKLKRDWVGYVFSYSFNSKARGEAISIPKKIPFELVFFSESVGCILMINCKLFAEPWSLLNVYAPNVDDEQFVSEASLILSQAKENILIRGDFNCVLDTLLDKFLKVDEKNQKKQFNWFP
ncbi:uncharacterized protein [Narcine bancroftii]|uniref:uncharacterized protein n=1 Tax=Narcine bancroftii TaxID=1343680 RepID=UPI0038320EE6